MFKWPADPSPKAGAHELADFVELVTWRNGRMSTVELTRYLSRLDEADYTDGVPEEDEPSPGVEAAFSELERRSEACAGGYPFSIGDNGHTARFSPNGDKSMWYATYMYLLLATRLNMSADSLHGGIDGTALFEELAAESVRAYLGGRSKSFVFGAGAAKSTGFKAKVDDLCQRLGEGNGCRDDVDGPTPRDGKLDVAAWIPFADGQPSKLVIFGQCKTGTNYKDHLTQLQPDAFFGNWCRSQPMVVPTRAFFVAEALPRSGLRSIAREAGILFDRCRIVECGKTAGPDVLAKIEAWTTEAATAAGIANRPSTSVP